MSKQNLRMYASFTIFARICENTLTNLPFSCSLGQQLILVFFTVVMQTQSAREFMNTKLIFTSRALWSCVGTYSDERKCKPAKFSTMHKIHVL